MIVNLRESLNTRDRKSVNGNSKYYDLVNLYESCNLSADNKKTLAKMINNNASDKAIYSFLYECYEGKEDIKEDTVKKDGKWVNKGKEGTHGEFKTKKAADAQRKAMFANGYKGESLKESTSIYRDYNGIMGNPGATWTIKELKAYWETNHNSDPVLNEYKSMQSWLNDTIAMLHPVTNDEYDESLKESKEGEFSWNNFSLKQGDLVDDDYDYDKEEGTSEYEIIDTISNSVIGYAKVFYDNEGYANVYKLEFDTPDIPDKIRRVNFAKNYSLKYSDDLSSYCKWLDSELHKRLNESLKESTSISDSKEIKTDKGVFTRFGNHWEYKPNTGKVGFSLSDKELEGVLKNHKILHVELKESLTEDDKSTALNDKYFPRVDINNTSRYDTAEFEHKFFAYDKKNNVLIYLFKDDEEVSEMGWDNAPWRELDSAGLSSDNWNDEEARNDYLHQYTFDLDSEASYLAQDFIDNELPHYQNKNESLSKSLNESNNAVYDMYKNQYKNLLQDIKYVLNSDNIEDIRAYDKESQGEYILSKLFDSRMNKQNMSFEDAKEDVIDFLYRTRADAKSELELRNKRSLESKSIMNKVKSELSKDYKLVSESEDTLYFKAPDNSTHDDCIAFVDKVVAVSGGKYTFTGRGGSWTLWDILTPEGSYIKAGYDYSNKDNYAVYFKSILTESRSTRSTSKESVDKSLKESLNLNEVKNIINVLNKNLRVRFKHSAGGIFSLDRTPFNEDTFNKLIKNNYKMIGDILEEQGLKYDISEDAYISKDTNLYVTIYGDTSTVIVQFDEMESESLKESLESEDGWSEEILDIVDPFFVEVEKVAYELRNTVRGAYRFGTTVKDLAQVFRGFSETTDDIANELDDNQEHLEEDWCSIKEEPHEECVGNNCTDEYDLFPEEKYFTIVVTRSDDGEDEIIDDVTKEIADKYIDDLKRDNDEFFSHAKVLDHNGEVVNSWEYLEEAAKSKKSSSIKDRLKKLIPDLDI